MMKYMLIRMSRDTLGHIMLIVFPIVMISVFSFVYKDVENFEQFVSFLSLGFILMFHYFGAGYTVEFIHIDFNTSMKDRLISSPAKVSSFPLKTIYLSSMLVFLQSMVILTYSVLVLKAQYDKIFLIIILIALAVIMVQFIGAIIVLKTNKLPTANGIMIGMGIVFPFLAQFNTPLPDHFILNFFRDFGTPFSLVFYGMNGLKDNFSDYLLSVGILCIGIALLVALFFRTTRKAI